MSGKAASEFDREMLTRLTRGAQKTFENAEALFREAQILGAAGALSRALFLHQISLEECAKIEIIGAWATGVLAGIPVDEKKVLAALTRHANKNRTNAYMLEGTMEEVEAKERGDWEVALSEFKKFQAEFHARSNAEKNASLYVDFEDGNFVAPFDRITAGMLAETARRNEMFLGLMFPKVELLLKWEKAPDDARESITAFVELTEATKAEESDNAVAAFDKLIEEFLARMATRSAKSEPRA